MTLDVENCHSTVHFKQANFSMLENSRSFIDQTMRESVKRVTKWAAYYHTSRITWYPKPEEAILFSQVPTMNPLPVVEMSQADCAVLRNWVSSYGATVRQCTVRQEMEKHGTLAEFMYQRHSVMLKEPITFVSGNPNKTWTITQQTQLTTIQISLTSLTRAVMKKFLQMKFQMCLLGMSD
ncbi:Hypothetical predicted protein [Paramuricea clavata]|uniref:Uncharacterized protein n=1 Tax=Paramuricea clavata TaxID=317549 RepID=A0A7D9ESC8_PARCT|nr:Hypothetical predicted protein [Paramuricea clavata]